MTVTVLLLAGLLGCVLSDKIDSYLTHWIRINSGIERVKFPVRDAILEIKSFRQDEADDPVHNVNSVSEFEVTKFMMLKLFNGDRLVSQQPLLWNTIKYKDGRDVLNLNCPSRRHLNSGISTYVPYIRNPCHGKYEQIWAWIFTPGDIFLTCDSEVLYHVNIDSSSSSSCKKIGSAPADTLEFTHMEGYFYRAVPMDGVLEEEPSEGVSNLELEVYPTCNCWTRECGYCSNRHCLVKYDLSKVDHGISVRSYPKWRKFSSVVLYNKDGVALGMFQWSLRGVFLTGCMNCRAPAALKRRSSVEGPTLWVFSIDSGVVKIEVAGETRFEHKLLGECAKHYSDVSYFAFYRMGCESNFIVRSDMIKGPLVTSDCGETCPAH